MRSSATLVQASGDSTGGRAQIEQFVDVPAPQILEQSVEVIQVILQEQCQLLFSSFRQCFWRVGEGCGSLAKAQATARVDVPTTLSLSL